MRHCFNIPQKALNHLRVNDAQIKELERRLAAEKNIRSVMLELCCPHWTPGALLFLEDGFVEYDAPDAPLTEFVNLDGEKVLVPAEK